METNQTNRLIDHASKRLQQRGVTFEDLALHESYADSECFVGNGRISRTISGDAVKEMIVMGVRPQQAEKVRRMAIIYTSNDKIITILFVGAGNGRTYRHGSRKRYRI